jgi:hypothetical protein
LRNLTGGLFGGLDLSSPTNQEDQGSSAFSFLQSEPEPADGGSAFSFLAQSTSVVDESSAGVILVPSDRLSDQPAPTSSGGFDFLMMSAPTEEPTQLQSSSFSFLDVDTVS